MKLLNFITLSIITIFISSCNPQDCTNNIQDGNETGIDCGGDCPSCITTCELTYKGQITSNVPADSIIYFTYTDANSNSKRIYLLSGQNTWDTTILKTYPYSTYNIVAVIDADHFSNYINNGGSWSVGATVSIIDGGTVIESDTHSDFTNVSSSSWFAPNAIYTCTP